VKHEGFRALAYIPGAPLRAAIAQRHTLKHWPQLCEELAHAVKAHDAILDGEIVCLDRRGRSHFKNLLFRREWPYFDAFDLLHGQGRLRRLIPSVPTQLLYVDHVLARGRDFFEVASEHDLEGIVGKLASGRYHVDGTSTNWYTIKNPA
jgi:bifunctional non-homologous end joining protein LigD